MLKMIRTVHVRRGDWRTLESFFNATGMAVFKAPRGAVIKVRYGVGWLGKDRQKQTLDGQTEKKLEIGSWSVTVARIQIKVERDTDVTYYAGPGGVAVNFPQQEF